MRAPAAQPWWVQLAYPEDRVLIAILALILLSGLTAIVLARRDTRPRPPTT